ncbi:MAG TPA: hypothetical protein PLV33_07625 [Opitutaceae bacterium]|nr:hypothetical protein [Opitutaceae bacterium]HOR24468.1 hypothetical protein [Opitutaceae bacterium]HPK48737.1 hypothetical protein [Opitutaceae bacterium]
MDTIETSFGTVSGIADRTTYASGAIKSCRVAVENRLQSPVGTLVPLYQMAALGERQKKDRRSLGFFESGKIKSVALDCAMPVRTPLGVFKAEAVSFYEDGAINRLFPLNGQIDGYWSERNEGALAERLDFDLPVGRFSAKIISLHFYPSGALKSLTLWPGERITLQTPLGPMRIRTGFSLYEDGAVRSVEPAGVEALATPVGVVKAFDAEVMGMNADQNSVRFSPAGRLISVKTIHTGLRVLVTGEAERRIEPWETASLIDDVGRRTVPMLIEFGECSIKVVAERTHRFEQGKSSITTFSRDRVIREACSSCAGCESGASCCQH